MNELLELKNKINKSVEEVIKNNPNITDIQKLLGLVLTNLKGKVNPKMVLERLQEVMR